VTTPDKMFTLDPIKTDVTQPLQHLKAHQDSDTSVADAQFSKGLSAFGAAVGDLAERKKQERIDSDIALAKEAAIRNEVMPGGLLPIAVDAFEKTQDIQTANQAYSDIEVFYEGEEVQTITNNSLLTPVQKNSQISTAIDNLFRVSASSVRDADVLLALKNKVDGLKTNSMKAVWNIDKNQKYGVSINAISSQIDNGFDSDIDPEEIFTNKWVKNVAGKLREGLPWVSGDDAKLTVFSSLANNPNMVANPDIMTNLMQAEFSKGVTFSALANASTTEAGQQISRIYARFLEKSDRHFADIRREEKEDEDDRNEIATEKGQEFLDSMDDPSDPDYANRFQSLRRIMVDEHNGSVGTFNKLVRIHTTLEEYTKNNFESKEHTDAKILISSGSIKTQKEVIEYVERNNLDTESRSLLISFLASDNKKYSKAIDQLKGQTNTVNGSLSSAIRLKIAPNSGMLAMFDKLGPEELKSNKIKISDILGGATVNPNELVDSMIELAELRDKLRVDMDAEVRAAIQEGRPVDSVSIVSSFHKQAQEFIRKIGEPEPEAVEEFEEDEDLENDTDEANEVEDFNTTPAKKAFIDTSKMHGSEKPVATFVNGIVKGLEVVRSVPEKAGKFLGEGMVKTFFALKEDIATLTTSDIKIEEVEEVLKKGEEIPKEVKEVLTKKSWVLDKLLNFFGEDKEKLTFGQSSETTMKFETAPTPAKQKGKKKFGGMAGNAAIILPKIKNNFKLSTNQISDNQYTESFEVLKDAIGFLESNNDYKAIQKSDKNSTGIGPARGKYQYEPESAKTAIQRLKNSGGSTFTETDFSKLSEKEQDMLFEADQSDRKGSAAGLKKIVEAKNNKEKAQALAEYWANVHKVLFLDEKGKPSKKLKEAGIEKAKDRLLKRLEGNK
jgi:hypothetical protein